MIKTNFIIEKVKDFFFYLFILMIFLMIAEGLDYDVIGFFVLTWDNLKLLFTAINELWGR
jgi:hypothetical protein